MGVLIYVSFMACQRHRRQVNFKVAGHFYIRLLLFWCLWSDFWRKVPVGQFELKHDTQHKLGSMYILCLLIRYVVVWCRESLLYHSGSVHQHGIANIRCISFSWSERATVSLDNDIIMVYLQPGLGNNFHIQWILRNLNSKTCTSNCYIGFHRNAV